MISSSSASVVAGGSSARISVVIGRGPIASPSAAITRLGRNCFASEALSPVACSRSIARERSWIVSVTPSKWPARPGRIPSSLRSSISGER